MSVVGVTSAEAAKVQPGPQASGGRVGAWARRFASPRLVVGAAIVGVFAVVGVIGPFFVHDANRFVGPALAAPSARFVLGTTQTGQSVLAQMVVSTRGTLEVGFAAGLLATAVSIMIGIGAAFLGGLVDELFALFTNVVLVIPGLPLVIIIAAYVKGGGLSAIVLVIAFTSWAASARVLRGQTLSVRNRDYVAAARVSGESRWRIVAVEILPNELAILISQFIFAVIFAILTQAGLAFIGVGNITTLTWGNMLYYANNDAALTSGAWWWFVPPGLAIALLGMGLALINFGLDELLNPRLRAPRAARGAK